MVVGGISLPKVSVQGSISSVTWGGGGLEMESNRNYVLPQRREGSQRSQLTRVGFSHFDFGKRKHLLQTFLS